MIQGLENLPHGKKLKQLRLLSLPKKFERGWEHNLRVPIWRGFPVAVDLTKKQQQVQQLKAEARQIARSKV